MYCLHSFLSFLLRATTCATCRNLRWLFSQTPMPFIQPHSFWFAAHAIVANFIRNHNDITTNKSFTGAAAAAAANSWHRPSSSYASGVASQCKQTSYKNLKSIANQMNIRASKNEWEKSGKLNLIIRNIKYALWLCLLVAASPNLPH